MQWLCILCSSYAFHCIEFATDPRVQQRFGNRPFCLEVQEVMESSRLCRTHCRICACKPDRSDSRNLSQQSVRLGYFGLPARVLIWSVRHRGLIWRPPVRACSSVAAAFHPCIIHFYTLDPSIPDFTAPLRLQPHCTCCTPVQHSGSATNCSSRHPKHPYTSTPSHTGPLDPYG